MYSMTKTKLTLKISVLLFVFTGFALAHDTDKDWFHPEFSTYVPEFDPGCSEEWILQDKIIRRYTILYNRHVVDGPRDQHWHFKFTAKVATSGGSNEKVISCGNWSTGSWHQSAVDFYESNNRYPATEELIYQEDLPDLEMDDNEWINQPEDNDETRESGDDETQESDAPTPSTPSTPPTPSNNADNRSETPPVHKDLPVVKIDDPIKVEDIVVPKPEPKLDPVVPKVYHEIQFHQGLTFVSIPVSVDGIRTLSDFWARYSFLPSLNGTIYVYLDGCWLAYNGGEGQIAGPMPLTPYTGLAVKLEAPSLLEMHGIPFPKEQTITLQPGGNFVGFPNLPIGIERPSDLIALGAEAVIVIVKGELKIVGRSGDDGDEPIRPNQALFVITQNTIMLEFEEVLAAPAAQSVNRTFITTWGSQKVR